MSEHIDKPTHVLFAFVDIKMHDISERKIKGPI
jgi:hypothetical protein